MDYKIVELPQMAFGTTNVIRIGDTIIDTGHVEEISSRALFEQMDRGALQGLQQVIISHPHIDHVGGSMGHKRIAELPHIVSKGSERIIQDPIGYIYEVWEEHKRLLGAADPVAEGAVRVSGQAYFPLGWEYQRVNIVRLVESGDEIEAGGSTLKIIPTPGHEEHHIGLFDEASGTLFSGDLIQHNAQFSWAPLSSRVWEYEKSLKAVLDLQPERVVPAHGDVIEDPSSHVNKCLANVGRTKQKILNYLRGCDGREITPSTIAKGIFEDPDPLRLGILILLIACYLETMEREGMVVLVGDDCTAKLA